MNKLSIAIAASLVLAACASSAPAPIKQDSQSASPLQTGAPQTGALSQAEIDAQALAAQTRDLHSIYFDYGTSDVKPEYGNIIQQQADFMNSHPGDIVTLEGNTDERGSNEFNLALADTRAGAVRKVMLVLGIPSSRIKTVSFGEEKPRLTCHEESCWKENRRVDFVHSKLPR